MPRDNDPAHLHPLLRNFLTELDGELAAAGIPLALYEGGRSPFRQVELFARGRGVGEPGKTVTRARAWASMHQYGMAVDYVFRVGERWTWEEPKRGMWDEFTRIARGIGLRTLSFEKPHAELPVVLSDLQAGRFPVGGDETWERWIEQEIERWGSEARTANGHVHPGAPPLPSLNERPPLVFADGLPPSPFGA
jgi:peptidoglycan LD-endopeptidase CwlK